MIKTKKLVLSGIFLAIAMILPFFTGNIPQIGNMLLPMHIPVLLCGFICGWQYGLAVGFVAPFLRFAMFGMPPILPVGTAMAFELAVYGALCGIIYKSLQKKTINIYITLILSMLAGRVAWAVAMMVISATAGNPFTWQMFAAGAFLNAVPGIILQLILVPAVVILVKKAGYLLNE